MPFESIKLEEKSLEKNPFRFREILEERFFEVHGKRLDMMFVMYLQEMDLFKRILLLIKKIQAKIQRARKEKNKRLVFQTKMYPTIQAFKKMQKRICNYLSAYRRAINRYGKPDAKAEAVESITTLLEAYRKM